MYVITVEFTIKPEFVSEFTEAIKRNAAQSRDNEEGCLVFDVCRAPEDPAAIFLYEVYVDEEAFQAHLRSHHFLAFDAAVAPWTAAKQVRVLTRLDG